MASRTEYPRPDFERESWQSLNGLWQFAFDDKGVGVKERWYDHPNFNQTIEVPFCFQSEASGIHDLSFHDHIWYYQHFILSSEQLKKRVVLHIGASDYETEIYVNGQKVMTHIGGHSSFHCDITDFLNDSSVDLVLHVYDPSTDEFIPRGKQYWKEQHESIWYPRTSGLWQPIWLEFVHEAHIDKFRLTPDIDKGILHADIFVSVEKDLSLEMIITGMDNQLINRQEMTINSHSTFHIDIFKRKVFKHNIHQFGQVWSPENPYLFNIKWVLRDGDLILDVVKSYFGMRKIHQKDGIIYLNNRPYYQKLVLDQGYYPKGLLTALNDEDFVLDITLAKQMGFNGCRKHQVVADPRFLYHADRLGFLVWGEMANAANYSCDYVKKIENEWIEVIKRDYNHPCIVAWVPLNESWGVPMINTDLQQQAHSLSLYHLTKSLDQTRLVASNDGWEMTLTDFCGIHNYAHGTEHEMKKQNEFAKTLKTRESMIQSMPAGRNIYAQGFQDRGEPILLTEFGGISLNTHEGWGYTEVSNSEDLLKQYQRIIDAIQNSECIRGFCYTQLTDVFQEQNGLLTFNRIPKVDVNAIKRINDFKPLTIKK
jgi:beta-galactosidase/beta-glucuronidase